MDHERGPFHYGLLGQLWWFSAIQRYVPNVQDLSTCTGQSKHSPQAWCLHQGVFRWFRACVCCSARDNLQYARHRKWSLDIREISIAPLWKRSWSQLSLSWLESPMPGSELTIEEAHGKKRRWECSKTDCKVVKQNQDYRATRHAIWKMQLLVIWIAVWWF